MKLPPLGPPPVKRDGARRGAALVEEDSAEGQPCWRAGRSGRWRGLRARRRTPSPDCPPAPDPVLQRRLEAPVLIRGAGRYQEPAARVRTLEWTHACGLRRLEPGCRWNRSGSGPALAGQLQPTRTAAVAAGVMPDRRFLLPKGAFIDCTLETAIDSSLPGMTTCIVATDVWSADGSVVLLERGTKLVGETRGEVRQGQKRLFVLWSEARTPTGVIVELASPGTDALGRSGVTGAVDRHFSERFGAAILISLIDAGTAALVAAQSDGGSQRGGGPAGGERRGGGGAAADGGHPADDPRAAGWTDAGAGGA